MSKSKQKFAIYDNDTREVFEDTISLSDDTALLKFVKPNEGNSIGLKFFTADTGKGQYFVKPEDIWKWWVEQKRFEAVKVSFAIERIKS